MTGNDMANLETLDREDLIHLAPILNGAEAAMGFVPNSMLTMAHMPQLTAAFSMLAGVVFGGDLQATMENYGKLELADAQAAEALPPSQVQLIAFSVSSSAGCRYCQAHTSHNAHRFGVSEEKLTQILNFEDSELFEPAEKALIAISLAAGQVPNAVEPHHFEALRAHFTQRQITQIVGVISLFGFLNRWNDTMATELEALPAGFATDTLSSGGWEIGKHTASGE